jgi:hypothetical protein
VYVRLVYIFLGIPKKEEAMKKKKTQKIRKNYRLSIEAAAEVEKQSREFNISRTQVVENAIHQSRKVMEWAKEEPDLFW